MFCVLFFFFPKKHVFLPLHSGSLPQLVPGMTQQYVPVQHYLYGRAGLRPLGDPGKGVVSMATDVLTALVQCSWRCAGADGLATERPHGVYRGGAVQATFTWIVETDAGVLCRLLITQNEYSAAVRFCVCVERSVTIAK